MNSQVPTGLRRRRPDSALTNRAENISKLAQDTKIAPLEKDPEVSYPTSSYIYRCILLFAVALYLAIWACDRRPDIKGRDVDPGIFSAERAWDHCNVIGHDYKWVGTEGLERALDYVERELRSMPGMEVQRQFASGAYTSDIARMEFTVSYGNITNVVARIGPKNDDGGSLIVNAHVDSAAGSPGASDDTANACVMLELARNLVANGKLKREVILLFNGAEEPVLAGAHAFVTQHAWMKGIAALINLEAMGSGKTALLFRQGPGASWLMNAYARAVEYPFALSSSNDIFETGLIPGETDKRVFDELTNIPSYDFVLFENGYTYHTTSDTVKHLSKDGLQHMGETVRSLVLELAGEADAIGIHISEQNEGKSDASLGERSSTHCNNIAAKWGIVKNAQNPPVVYFHVLNLFTLTFDLGVMVILNCSLAVFTVFMWAVKFALTGRQYLFTCIKTLAVYLTSISMGIVIGACCAWILSSGGISMVWFGSLPLLFALYTPFTLFGILMCFEIFPRMTRDDRFSGMVFSLSIFYTAFMMLLTYLGATSAAQMFFYLVPITAVAMVPSISRYSMMLAYFLLAIPFSIFGIPSYQSLMHVLLPVLGRVGNQVNIDAVASVVSMFFFVLTILNPFLPVLASARRNQQERLRHLCLIIGSAALLYVIQFRVPRAIDSRDLPKGLFVGPSPADPRYAKEHPKRIVVVHFDTDQLSGSFLYLSATDAIPIPQQNMARILTTIPSDNVIEWGSLARRSKVTESVRPFASFLSHVSTYAVSEAYALHLPTPQTALAGEQQLGNNARNISLIIRGPASHQLTLRLPVDSSKESYVSKWSLGEKLNDMGDGGGVYARHVGHGVDGEEWRLWVIVYGKLNGDVTSTRFGKSKSELLSKVGWGEGMAPVLMQSTGSSFEF